MPEAKVLFKFHFSDSEKINENLTEACVSEGKMGGYGRTKKRRRLMRPPFDEIISGMTNFVSLTDFSSRWSTRANSEIVRHAGFMAQVERQYAPSATVSQIRKQTERMEGGDCDPGR
jgi:hypothetical protein